MNKLLGAVLILSAGAVGAGRLHQTAEQTQAQRAPLETAWRGATNELAERTATLESLRAEVANKRSRLAHLPPTAKLDPDLIQLLEGGAGSSAAWVALRGRLGISWENSADYVFVNKRVINQLTFDRLLSGMRATDTACAVLGISASEQSGVRTALEHARATQWSLVERTEPSGDVVAQYTIAPPDRAHELSISNAFAADITSALGPERAALFVAQGWREFRRSLAPVGSEPAVLTLWRSVVNGEPGLVYELREGDSVQTHEVEYAHYPTAWFLTLFPVGWQTLAQREGFDLPKNFKKDAGKTTNIEH